MTNKEAAEVLLRAKLNFKQQFVRAARRSNGKSLTILRNGMEYLEALDIAINTLNPGVNKEGE